MITVYGASGYNKLIFVKKSHFPSELGVGVNIATK